MRIIAVLLLVGFVSTSTSNSSNHPTDGVLSIVYNLCSIAAIIAFIALPVEWWKNRKTNKDWFNWRFISVLFFISLVGLLTLVVSQSLTIARQKGLDAAQVNSTSDNWIVYVAPESNFSVQFPAYPVHTTKTQDTANGTLKVESYAQANSTASVGYEIYASVFPQSKDLSDSAGILENTVALTAQNGTVVTSTSTTRDGYPAIDYLVEIIHPGGGTTRIRGLNVLAGQRLYQVLVGYDKPDESQVEFDKFESSFHIN
jgi:hypothetical protein